MQSSSHGVYNGCAPEPVRNVDFTGALAACLRRPAMLPLPGWLLRLMLGEMAVLLLGGQRTIPNRTLAAGLSTATTALAWRCSNC